MVAYHSKMAASWILLFGFMFFGLGIWCISDGFVSRVLFSNWRDFGPYVYILHACTQSRI
jgi:hypothetical protein